MTNRWKAASLLLLCTACIEMKDDKAQKSDSAGNATPAVATAADSNDISAPSYDAYALDTAGTGARYTSTPAEDSAYARISEKSTASSVTGFPAKVPKRGAMALQLQVMLDRAHFSPGIIDGVWGDNAVKALYYYRNPTGGDSAAMPTDSASSIDQATYQQLKAAMGSQPILTKYTVTAEDVKGPFKSDIPDNVYEQAKLDCLCYTSAAEALAEKFHTSQKLLAQLNPKATLGNLTAGTSLIVPNVDVQSADSASAGSTGTGQVARLIISRKGYWTHGVDASGKVLYHFPSTLGAGYDPSPQGDFRVTNIAWNPAFHYQPTLFAEVSDKKPEAHLPKGPNSPVGVVWMALSKPHYGIHGTSSPETIGYANSHGCVRLTNWDATELGHLISKGVAVQFM